MAGQWLLEQMKSRGGVDSDYSDILFGTVTSTSPLTVQASNNLPLTGSLLTLGRNVTDHDEKMVIDGATKTITIKQGLKSGDGVAMIRGDGGQTFYIFEKVSEEGD